MYPGYSSELAMKPPNMIKGIIKIGAKSTAACLKAAEIIIPYEEAHMTIMHKENEKKRNLKKSTS